MSCPGQLYRFEDRDGCRSPRRDDRDGAAIATSSMGTNDTLSQPLFSRSRHGIHSVQVLSSYCGRTREGIRPYPVFLERLTASSMGLHNVGITHMDYFSYLDYLTSYCSGRPVGERFSPPQRPLATTQADIRKHPMQR